MFDEIKNASTQSINNPVTISFPENSETYFVDYKYTSEIPRDKQIVSITIYGTPPRFLVVFKK